MTPGFLAEVRELLARPDRELAPGVAPVIAKELLRELDELRSALMRAEELLRESLAHTAGTQLHARIRAALSDPARSEGEKP